MHRRRPAPLMALLWALLIILAASAPLAITPAGAQRPAPRVYVLRGGDAASDAAVAAALRARGFVVEVGVDSIAFDGSQATLRRYDAVVLLYGSAWQSPVPAGGVDAIEAYVQDGGSLITGEWAVSSPDLGALTPGTNCGYSSLRSTTFRQLNANPAIADGLPASFVVNLPAISGSEACLAPRPEATVLAHSVNGEPRLRAGLLAWNVGAGRVASFSTLLGATELQSPGFQRLLQNTVFYLAGSRDMTPPTVRGLTLAGAGRLVGSRQVALEVVATDSGGSGMAAAFITEYVFSGDPANPWRIAGRSGWAEYRPPRLSLNWQLDPTPGVHFLQVFVADRAGNVSSSPALAFVSYQPAQSAIALDQTRIYRLSANAGDQVSVRMDVLSGNPDLYVFGPGITFAPGSNSLVEQTSFTAQAGVYQIEVEGYQAGSYTLSAGAALNAIEPDPSAGLERRARGSIIFLARFEPGPDLAELTPPPLSKTYLPMLITSRSG